MSAFRLRLILKVTALVHSLQQTHFHAAAAALLLPPTRPVLRLHITK